MRYPNLATPPRPAPYRSAGWALALPARLALACCLAPLAGAVALATGCCGPCAVVRWLAQPAPACN